MAWFLAPALVRLRAEINTLWPNRDRASDGSIGDASHAARKSDHNADHSAGGIVRAIDTDKDGIPADSVVAQIIRDQRVAYVIWNGRIWENPAVYPGRGYWRAYTGANAHRQHFHVSVRRGTRWDHDASSWGITASTSAGGSFLPPVSDVPDVTAPTLIDPNPLGENMAEARIRRQDGTIFYARIDSGGGAFVGLDGAANTVLDRLGVPIAKDGLSAFEVAQIRQAVVDLSKHRIDPA